ncbi:MAG: hypothetical protein KF752_05145 [Pirellulaceae bacterium]|nr:hypothetical protein [Pirellulaceae bacterium]
MDIQDLQDNRLSDLRVGDITEQIIGCPFEVINELGPSNPQLKYQRFR